MSRVTGILALRSARHAMRGLLIPLAVALPARAEEIPLRLRLRPGDAFRQTISVREARSPVAVNPAAPDVTATREDTIVSRVRIEPGANGASLVRMTLEQIRVGRTAPRKVFLYDSASPSPLPADPETRPLAEAIAGTLGKEIVMTLDATGTVTEIQMPPQFPPDIASNSGPIGNPLSGIPGLFPNRPVKPGDRWTHEASFDMPFLTKGVAPLRLTFEHTFQAFDGEGAGRAAVIVSQIAVAPRKAGPGAPLPPQIAPCTVGGSGTITSRFLIAAGCIARSQGDLRLVLTPDPESAAPGIRKVLMRQVIDIALDPIPANQ